MAPAWPPTQGTLTHCPTSQQADHTPQPQHLRCPEEAVAEEVALPCCVFLPTSLIAEGSPPWDHEEATSAEAGAVAVPANKLCPPHLKESGRGHYGCTWGPQTHILWGIWSGTSGRWLV